jgi:hypothetical protein
MYRLTKCLVSLLAMLGMVQAAPAANIERFSPLGEQFDILQAQARFSAPMAALGHSDAPAPFSVDCDVPGNGYVDPVIRDDGTTQTAWLYQDALNPVAQLDGLGRLQQVYVYATRGHVPDAIQVFDPDTGTQTATWAVISDLRGSVRAVVDVATGTVMRNLSACPVLFRPPIFPHATRAMLVSRATAGGRGCGGHGGSGWDWSRRGGCLARRRSSLPRRVESTFTRCAGGFMICGRTRRPSNQREVDSWSLAPR